MHINVIGAGLAGCEAAMQIAKRGIKVHLYEMKPHKKSPAHHSDLFGELVCSNSLKASRTESAAGLLKEEMRRLDSFLMKCTDKCKVPAGGALAVDRDIFSQLVTDGIKGNPNIEIFEEETGYLFSGDLIYKGTLFANYESTDPEKYFESVKKIAKFSIKRT